MALLEFKNVNKGYGPKHDRTEVLRSMDLVVEEGDMSSDMLTPAFAVRVRHCDKKIGQINYP